ncbi:MAG: M16 family metallopeptidase [Candidatus Nanopelagicales bacterium]
MRRTQTRTVLEGADGALVRRTVLPSGLRIVTECVPGVRSVSFGVWVGVGSRDEAPQQMGSAHFLEHLLFKGTRRRSAWEISAAIEAVGGEMNAFTTKEYTCYYARVLDDDTALAVDVVCDVVNNGLLESGDIESEREVILEEIAMNEDDAADVVHDLFMDTYYGPTPLGRSILGTQETIAGLSARGIRSFYRRNYVPSRIVVSAAGSVDHDEIVRLVREAFAGHVGEEQPEIRTPTARGAVPRGRGRTALLSRPLEQANIVLGWPGLRRTDDRRYALGVLNAALGGGMSSRLFQRVREERGLAYSVYSFVTSFSDSGFTGVYAGCLPGKVSDVVQVCRDAIADVVEHGLTAEELQRGKGQMKGGVVLGQEDTGARMSRIAKGELLYDEIPSIDEVIDRVDAVTHDDVHALARDLLRGEPTYAVIGPFGDELAFA